MAWFVTGFFSDGPDSNREYTVCTLLCSLYRSVGIATGFGLDDKISIPFKGKGFFSSSQFPDRLYLWLYIPFFFCLCPFFNYLIIYTVGMTPLTGDQHVASALPTQRATQTQNKRIQTCMPWEGFAPTVRESEDSSCLRPRGHCDRLASERAKTVHALDRAATVMGLPDRLWGLQSPIQWIPGLFPRL
jgi:hypothetical protein